MVENLIIFFFGSFTMICVHSTFVFFVLSDSHTTMHSFYNFSSSILLSFVFVLFRSVHVDWLVETLIR